MKSFKKILIIFFGIFALFVGILIAIPFLYSIDKFRPEIEAQIEKSVSADVVLGELTFKLFPKVVVGIDGLKLTPKKSPYEKSPLIDLKKFELQMPLYALLVAPSVNIFLDSPQILIDQNGDQSNIAAILPDTPPAEVATPPGQTVGNPSAPPPAVGEMLKTLPPFLSEKILKARMSFELKNAKIDVVDRKAPKGTKTSLQEFSIKLRDIGLATPMGISVSGQVDLATSGAIVKGPFKVFGNLQYKPVDKNNEVSFNITKDISGLDIRYAPFFHKAPNTAFAAEVEGVILQSPDLAKVNMKKLGLKFANVLVDGNFSGDFPLSNPMNGTFKTGFNVKDFELAAWGALVPMVKDFALGGKVSVDIDASGALADPLLNLSVSFKDITGSTPELKKPIKNLTGVLAVTGKIANPKVKLQPFSMNIGESDLSVSLSTEGIKDIGIDLKVTSNRLNADELLGLEPLKIEPGAAGAAPAPKAAEPTPEELAKMAAIPLDEALISMAPMVEEQLKNPMLDHLKAKIAVDFKYILAMGAEIRNTKTNLLFENRVLTMNKTGLETYGGVVMADMNLNMKNPAEFGFAFNAGLQNVNFGNMLATHAPSWKKDISGIINGQFVISGRGLRKEQLEQNLRGGLKGEIKNGKLSLPVIKIVNVVMDEIPKLQFLGAKIPERNKNQEAKGEFKTCVLDTSIQGRMVKVDNLDVVYDTKGGGLGDLRFQATGTTTFDQKIEFLGTAFMSPEVVRIPELKGPSGQIELPIKMKGTMTVPETDTQYTLKILGDRLAKNLLKSKEAEKLKAQAQKAADEAKAKAEAEAKKAATEALQKAAEKAPEPVKKGIDQLKKKFKF
jgi:hypothetical protein